MTFPNCVFIGQFEMRFIGQNDDLVTSFEVFPLVNLRYDFRAQMADCPSLPQNKTDIIGQIIMGFRDLTD